MDLMNQLFRVVRVNQKKSEVESRRRRREEKRVKEANSKRDVESSGDKSKHTPEMELMDRRT